MSDLIDRFLDGDLPEPELAALAHAVRDPATARALVCAAADEWGLRQALRGQSGNHPTALTRSGTFRHTRTGVRRRRSSSWRSPLTAATMAMAAAILVVMVLWPSIHRDAQPDLAPAPVASLDMIAGPPPEDAATLIATAAPLVFAEGSVGTLHFDDGGNRLRIKGPAVIRVHRPDLIHCEHGHVQATIVTRPTNDQWTITTPHARCSVLGTRFTLAVDDEQTRLAVDAGRVAFARPDGVGQTICGPGVNRSLAAGPPPLLRYAFVGTEVELLHCTESRGESPAFEDIRPPLDRDGGLYLTTESHCVTPTNAAWPHLAALLRKASGITLAVRVGCAQDWPQNVLLAELYCGARSGDHHLLQVRQRGARYAGTHTFATVWTVDGALLHYRDGQLQDSEQRPFPIHDLDDVLQLKLYLPNRHHDPPPETPGVTFHELRLYDRALSPAELR